MGAAPKSRLPPGSRPQRTYIRDGRAPVPASSATSAAMSAVRARDTSPERKLRRALRTMHVWGYRLHRTDLPGRPDLSFARQRLAVFVNGCFWHRCPHCRPAVPRTHTTFWEAKFSANMERDMRKARTLKSAGWRVATVWECKVNEDPTREARKIRACLEPRPGQIPTRLTGRFPFDIPTGRSAARASS